MIWQKRTCDINIISKGSYTVASSKVVWKFGQVTPLSRLRVVTVHCDQFITVLVTAPNHHKDFGQTSGGPGPHAVTGPVVAVVLTRLEAAGFVHHSEASGRQVDERVTLHVS